MRTSHRCSTPCRARRCARGCGSRRTPAALPNSWHGHGAARTRGRTCTSPRYASGAGPCRSPGRRWPGPDHGTPRSAVLTRVTGSATSKWQRTQPVSTHGSAECGMGSAWLVSATCRGCWWQVRQSSGCCAAVWLRWHSAQPSTDTRSGSRPRRACGSRHTRGQYRRPAPWSRCLERRRGRAHVRRAALLVAARMPRRSPGALRRRAYPAGRRYGMPCTAARRAGRPRAPAGERRSPSTTVACSSAPHAARSSAAHSVSRARPIGSSR
jgi:hypothetical protein